MIFNEIKTEMVLALTIYIVVKDLLIPLVRKIKPNYLNAKRVANKNPRSGTRPNMIPGKSETCIKHGEKLVKIETELTRIMEDIKELGIKLDKRRK